MSYGDPRINAGLFRSILNLIFCLICLTSVCPWTSASITKGLMSAACSRSSINIAWSLHSWKGIHLLRIAFQRKTNPFPNTTDFTTEQSNPYRNGSAFGMVLGMIFLWWYHDKCGGGYTHIIQHTLTALGVLLLARFALWITAPQVLISLPCIHDCIYKP